MIDELELRDMLQRRAGTISASPLDAPRATKLARRRLTRNAILGVLAGILIVVGALTGVRTIRAAPTPADHPIVPPSPGIPLRHGGEVLRFATGPGDLVAVDPQTGASRVLVGGVIRPYRAEWSADGRWVAYDSRTGLWVTNAEDVPRWVAKGPDLGGWTWSPTDARLATVNGSRLIVLDAPSGRETNLGHVAPWNTSIPVWSPDGTQLVFGVRGGSLYSVDVASGDRSLIVSLPGNLDSIDRIEWSPDGARLAILADLVDGLRRVYVVGADGSDARILIDEFEPGGNDFGAWSPDGTSLAYTALEMGFEFWRIDLDGSAPTRLASPILNDCPIDGCGIVWSPDGSRIAFSGSGQHAALDVEGNADPVPIDKLTYQSWSGGSYSCGCRG